MAGVEELVGLGVTIALTDLFTEGAEKIAAKFEEMEKQAGGSGEKIKGAIEGIKVGMGLLGAGAAIFAPMAMLADKSAEVADAAEDIKTVYEGLAPGGNRILRQVKALGGELRTIPTSKLVDAGRDMLGMGVAAERIPTLLRAAGISATVLGDGIQSSVHRMKMLNDMAEQGVAPKKLLQKMGVSFEDLGAEGIHIDKHGKFKASAEEYMDAVSNIITKRLGATATKLGEGLSGILPDIDSQFGKFYLHAGNAGILSLKTGMMQGYLDLLKALNLDKVGQAFGEGLSRFYKWLMLALRPVEIIVLALAKFIGTHPGIVKFATTFALITASVLVLTGAFIILGGLLYALPLVLSLLWSSIVAGVTAAWAVITPFLPALILLGAASYILYRIWTDDFMGIRNMITDFVDSIEAIVEAVVAMFTEDGDGQLGSVPAALHDKLVDKGLWEVAKGIFLWGYRLYAFFLGLWDGIVAVFSIAGAVIEFVFGVIIVLAGIVFDAFMYLVKAIAWVSEKLFGFSGFGLHSITIMQTIGYIIGLFAGVWLVALAAAYVFAGVSMIWNTAQMVYNAVAVAASQIASWGLIAAAYAGAAALWAVNAAVWLVNAGLAILTSPVTLIVLAVLAIGVAIAAVIAYWDVLMYKMESAMDNPAIRWMMRKTGLIDEKTTDAQLDEAAKQRDQAYQQSIAEKKAAGREGFMARMVDILPGQIGVPGGGATVEQALPRSVSPEQAENEDMMQRLENLKLKGATREGGIEGQMGISPEELLSRSPANEHVGATNEELLSRIDKQNERPIEMSVFLDGEQIHSSVRRHEQELQSRAGG